MLVKSHKSGFFENLEKFRLNGGMSRLIFALESQLIKPVLRKHSVKSVIHEKKFLLKMDRKQALEDYVVKNQDALIITVPPRLWNGGDLFNLTLTSNLIPQMGDSIKVLIRVPAQADFSPGILPSAFLEKNSLVQAIWESGIGQHPESKILTVMCGGPAAEQLGRLNQQEAISQIVKEITTYHPAIKISEEKENFYFKDWGRKRHTGCGYGCPAPYELTDFRPELEEMLPENLHLCGEWNSWEMWGYMEGAIRSALTAVLKICRSYGAVIPEFLNERLDG